ncbi:MAG: methylamine utilization protein, partial [Pseudoalteromonas sp.]
MKLLITFALLLAFNSQAVTLIVSNQNKQVQPNVVVWLQPTTPIAEPPKPETTFVMEQKDRQFTPHILVVEQNGKVDFPNADSIMHHVYSFSKSKSFELKLYREQPQDPIIFDQTGVVELGCNIHDWMLGYIVVVDSPYYGITDQQGQLTLDIPQGDYTINTWH